MKKISTQMAEKNSTRSSQREKELHREKGERKKFIKNTG